MTDPFPFDRRAHMTIDQRLRDADITPTTDAAKAFRLGFQAGRISRWQDQDKAVYATIIDRATTRVKP
ncbi:hypothetical protein UFOVP952_2 [uncultured Caudovirales phage]|uniref:Uncharacterized protein n=1 Tax=uncultured Caudovirales phage TaxID=2100421 RepID=A0A6J5PNI8_9CAUD|nr:hypothetical protein UFOVP952_2 [uncultured Caudovirales phage]CAB4204309.1 hypothetical protein UFOVP1392_47 [uncultured Caudovirales phage]CAB5230211.1 hypothetical protein UFOVP1569_46 [uncultured Caudovirales phage]